MPTVSHIFFINKINMLLPSQIVVDEHSQVARKNFAIIIFVYVTLFINKDEGF